MSVNVGYVNEAICMLSMPRIKIGKEGKRFLRGMSEKINQGQVLEEYKYESFGDR
jgi:hypothetical protein